MRKYLFLLPAIFLIGCAQTTTIGGLTVDSVTGIFDPSISLATARDKEGHITIQQIVSGPGAGQIIYNGAAQVGASAVFGIGAASQYKPNKTNVTTNNGNRNVSNSSSHGGSSSGGAASSTGGTASGGAAIATGFSNRDQ